jgi:hypothetical protein
MTRYTVQVQIKPLPMHLMTAGPKPAMSQMTASG